MRTVPLFMKGAFRSAMRVALEEAQERRQKRRESTEIVSSAPQNVVEQATSWRACPQEAIGGAVPEVQRRSVGRVD